MERKNARLNNLIWKALPIRSLLELLITVQMTETEVITEM